MNIMFTCAGRRVALMNAFRDAMKELNLTGRIIAADLTSASAAYHEADVGITLPPTGRIEYIPALLDAVKKYDVKLIVPVTDLDLRSLARQRDKFEKIGCTVMIACEETVALCRDKARSNELFNGSELSGIKTCMLNEFRKDPFYPCFVKPVRGSGGVGIGVLRNQRELRAHVATFGELLVVQEYVPGQEFTIDVYRSRDGQVRCAVPRQRLAVRSGEAEKAVTIKDDSLIEATLMLSDLLDDLWGVFCCQCRRPRGGKPRFFEINPRFGGGIPLSIAAGANFPLYLLQEVLGEPITAELGRFQENMLMLRYDEAVFTRVDDINSLPGYDAPFFR